ncbi:MAG: hypothetical protein A4E28_00850 [Methanocella sp. PtaU1.Bin125]|nr:MAG: hypothetical protein A4E28_00850 [Methanocella sp. PtaU1.Bin125]
MNRIVLILAEVVAGAVIGLVLYGLYAGVIGSLVPLSEATGVYLVLFFILLGIIDLFLFVYTLAGWEHE